MNSEHIQTDTVKNYLLGILSDEEASAIEKRYFSNPLFFDEIRSMEIQLICAFLDEELTPEEQEQFRRRYMEKPRLRKLVEDVRERRAANIPRSRLFVLIGSVAATLACVAAISYWLLRNGPTPPSRQASVETHQRSISLLLEPGVTMGAGSETKKLVLSSQVLSVSLVAELPGQTVSADYIAQVFSIGRDANRNKIFTSGPIRSVLRTGGQQITVNFSSGILSSGDYLMELQSTNGKVTESYIFRVTITGE